MSRLTRERINGMTLAYLYDLISFDTDIKLDMVKNMQTYGGHFVKSLAECFVRADQINAHKLAEAFTTECITYLVWDKPVHDASLAIDPKAL